MRAAFLRLRRRAELWLFGQRDLEPGEVFLHQRRVFILPTRAGMGYCALLLVLMIGSINYNLGLGFALTFALATCGVVDMVLTYRNLAHLHLRPIRVQPVFAGEEAQFELQISNRTRVDRYAVWIDFATVPSARQVSDVASGAASQVTLSTPASVRGLLDAPRVRLHTRFPLGLFRGWSYWQPDLRALVYPYPEPLAPPLPSSGSASDEGHGAPGQENFAGIRSYQPGDPMRHLAWRQIARLDPSLGGQLVTKQFDSGAIDELVLDFDALAPQLDLELRLSRMTRWVLDAEQRGLTYGFRLSGQVYPNSHGAAHQAACLRALALYGLAEAP